MSKKFLLFFSKMFLKKTYKNNVIESFKFYNKNVEIQCYNSQKYSYRYSQV